ncbi:hypothetical protein V1478_011870 [Vespula squamosa]|uniref:Uncharacterized protein n=1 Tax=Vespula squamosa TaxID=30214 RepID=A0ABD2ABL7_VESSQ
MTSTTRTILVLGKNINACDPAAAKRIHEFSDLLGQCNTLRIDKSNGSKTTFVNVNHPSTSPDPIITCFEYAYTRHSNKARQLLYSKRIAYDLYYLTTCHSATI